MIITRDQLSSLNFGYLNGLDLLQYCPEELLVKQYTIIPSILQTGCNQAYSYVKAKLCNRYDINSVLSNANQSFKDKIGSFQVTIKAGTYISRITFSIVPFSFQKSQVPISGNLSVIDISPIASIGTTDGDADLLDNVDVGKGYVYFLNKYFAIDTILYFNISGSKVNINLAGDMGITMPPIIPVGILNQSRKFTYIIPANTYIYQLFAGILLSTPSVSIGTTDGGSEVIATTLIADATLDILCQYFDNETILYFDVTGGSVNFRLDLGYNFVAPTPADYQIKDDLLTEILTIRAIKNILGSIAGANKQLAALIEENENIIMQIQDNMMSLSLPVAPAPLNAVPYMIDSSFKTLG